MDAEVAVEGTPTVSVADGIEIRAPSAVVTVTAVVVMVAGQLVEIVHVAYPLPVQYLIVPVAVPAGAANPTPASAVTWSLKPVIWTRYPSQLALGDTPEGNEPRFTVPIRRLASAWTQPSPDVVGHTVPEGATSRFVYATSVPVAAAMLPRTVVRLTPCGFNVKATDVATPAVTFEFPHGCPSDWFVPETLAHAGDWLAAAAVVLTVVNESVPVALSVRWPPSPESSTGPPLRAAVDVFELYSWPGWAGSLSAPDVTLRGPTEPTLPPAVVALAADVWL